MKEIPAVYRLMQNAKERVCEVRVSRDSWARPTGELYNVSIAAAKQLNRRALESLYYPNLVAVGMVKVAVGPEYEVARWKCEIHQLVMGAEKANLDKAFSHQARVKETENLGQAISDVLRRDLQQWQHPWQENVSGSGPTEEQRAEFHEWLMTLTPGDRLFRYGCDRYFNKLTKRPRTLKARKKHPYPFWLERHMFGNHPHWCRCRACTGGLT